MNIRLFVDDIALFICSKDPAELKTVAQSQLSDLLQWFNRNKLTLSLGKSNFCVYTPKNEKVPHYLNSLTIQNNVIKRISEVTYLGLTIDDKLSWDTHINTLCLKLSSHFGDFKYIRDILPSYLKR